MDDRTAAATYKLQCDANGFAIINARKDRCFLQVSPVVAAAWTLQYATQPDGTTGITFSAQSPVATYVRREVGDSICGLHRIVGTANQTFAVLDIAEAP